MSQADPGPLENFPGERPKQIRRSERALPDADKFPNTLLSHVRSVIGPDGGPCVIPLGSSAPYALRLGSRAAQQLIRDIAARDGLLLRKADLADVEGLLEAHATTYGEKVPLWYRVAPWQDGIELDVGDAANTRIRVTAAEGVQRVEGSEVIFLRHALMRPMVLPAAVGNLALLDKYVSMNAIDLLLFKIWLAYTLSQPKRPESKFVILVLSGHQGSGKSFLCKIIQRLLDPSVVSVQMLPMKPRDLAVAARDTHVLFYDNVRSIPNHISDALCILATGGALTTRRLFSDADQQVLHLHGALVLNGISNFLDQPDLAQRSLHLPMAQMPAGRRRSERELAESLEADLPVIFAGLLELVAEILRHLPHADVVSPQRMYDFVRYLAAAEAAEKHPRPAYQLAYAQAITEGQRDALQDSELGAAVLEFAQDLRQPVWSGTPTEFLDELSNGVNEATRRSRDWPRNAIALSKRLIPLEAALRSQGFSLTFGRGKQRTITIRRVDE